MEKIVPMVKYFFMNEVDRFKSKAGILRGWVTGGIKTDLFRKDRNKAESIWTMNIAPVKNMIVVVMVIAFSLFVTSPSEATRIVPDSPTFDEVVGDKVDKTNNAVIVGSILLLAGIFIAYYIMHSPSKVSSLDKNQDSTEHSTEPQTKNPGEIALIRW